MKWLLPLVILATVVVLSVVTYLYIIPKGLMPQKPQSGENVLITLERKGCFGTCPDYLLAINGDGVVTYEGRGYVEVKGEQKGQISEEKLAELIDAFYDLNYFALQDSYESESMDGPVTVTSITIGDRKKQVEHSAKQTKLTALEKKIDEVTNSQMWVGE